MRRKLPPLWVGWFLCALLISTPLVSCSSWKATTYKSVGSTVITADSAMRVWAVYVAAGKATADREAQVRLAYNRYRTAMNAVIDAGKIATTANNTAAFDVAIDVASSAQSNLVAIIRLFTK
jgi:hypothetical protein